jgi:hypothetical protein
MLDLPTSWPPPRGMIHILSSMFIGTAGNSADISTITQLI